MKASRKASRDYGWYMTSIGVMVTLGLYASNPTTPAIAQDRFWEAEFAASTGNAARLGRQIVAFRSHYAPGTIVVSYGDRRLYYIMRPGEAISYPIGVPTGRASWSGVERVSMKRVNPTWTPTPNMRRENPDLPAQVPGGHPQNPLGVRALYLGNTLYRIHGTDAPWTIGQEVSRGCIRLYNEDIIDLYDRARVGARVIVTRDPVLAR